MYDCSYVGVEGMVKILGICRPKVMTLCSTRPYNFPVVKVGNRYRADETKLLKWRDDWYSGKFDLKI